MWFVLLDVGAADGGSRTEHDADAELRDGSAAAASPGTNIKH